MHSLFSNDRRREPRRLVSATAALFSQRRYLGLCLVEDISNTGVLLVGEFPLQATALELLVQEPGCEPVRYVGDLVRKQERADGTRQFAVKFRERADQSTSPAALTEYVLPLP